jgi:uncharacterized protein
VQLDPASAAQLLAAGFAAQVMNSLAGGGTVLTFPTMLLLGLDARVANATSTVALVPGAASSLWGFRREVATHRPWLRTLLLPSLFGGAVGSVLLVWTPEGTFRALAPWLVLFATLLFLAQALTARIRGTVAPTRPARHRFVIVWVYQFGVAVYGGYFGAGIGILMLVALGFLGLTDILAMNGLKAFFGMAINFVACAAFVAADLVAWPVALVTMAGAVAGGLAGARLARHIGRDKARWAVVVVGLLVTALLLWQR